ncbi:hypothetical protein BJ741DRAFT_623808 [Chytriomyces cf. hyalinus JEL632]|nr:hypothetical protein BJ741DRAFT_623808 [Chytriomyces cf. hyalinus JEL632]
MHLNMSGTVASAYATSTLRITYPSFQDDPPRTDTDKIMIALIILLVALSFTAFCIQVIVSIARENRLRLRDSLLEDGQHIGFLVAQTNRPLSQAQINSFPIKVFIPKGHPITRRLDESSREGDEMYPPSASSNNHIERIHILDEIPAQIPVNDSVDLIGQQESLPCCPVCLEDFKELEVLRELPCKHLFHRRCIDTWLSLSCFCPTCRNNTLSRRRDASRRSNSSASQAPVEERDGSFQSGVGGGSSDEWLLS